MSTSANCPGCGAPVIFRWSSAVQTTCEFCKSILVRTDVDLKKVGVVADLPPDSSPIQIGTEGAYGNKSFVVTGRILYEYEQGAWNEWHIVFNDSTSGWLSDAQLEYALSWLVPNAFGPLPRAEDLARGQDCHSEQLTYEVTSITRAHYKGVQGELPFEYWDKTECIFADLRTTTSDFATIDYTEQPPLVFLGRGVDFNELHLKNLRLFEGWS
jgi:hypothetical protein